MHRLRNHFVTRYQVFNFYVHTIGGIVVAERRQAGPSGLYVTPMDATYLFLVA